MNDSCRQKDRPPRHDNAPKAFSKSRDSLQISQPAERILGHANHQFSMEFMGRSSREHIQSSELKSGDLPRQHSQEHALPMSEKGRVVDCECENVYSPADLEKTQVQYCINPRQAQHQ